MCGRFTLHHKIEDITDRFAVQQVLVVPEPSYNVAPSQPLAVITQNGQRTLDAYRWGLVPFWAKDPAIGNKLINARAETLAQKPAFKAALKRRRCLIPADGFYEWRASQPDQGKKKGARTPLYIRRPADELFGFAGLWEEWTSPDGSPLRTCTIITTAPNELMASIHDRMPAILQPEDEAEWLDPGSDDLDELLQLLHPYPDGELAAREVSRLVNSPGTNTPDCIAGVDDPPGLN